MRKKLFLIFLFLILGFLFVKSSVFIFEFTRKQTMFIVNAFSETSATKSVNFTASSSKEMTKIYSLNITRPIYSLSVSGNIVLNSESSLVRIILINSDEDEHLVYEVYPLIVEDNTFSFNDVCEETCLLDSITPVSLKIDLFNATVKINKISFFDDFEQLGSKTKAMGITSAKKELKITKDNLKIQKINEQIKKKGMKWIAAETSVSKMTYAEKKRLFSKPDGTPVDKLPNLQGFEYYKGGIFEIKSVGSNQTSSKEAASYSGLPESWDWRNIHGGNWNTPVKNQGSAGTCWAHARLGAMESMINLYFNQHLNIDLSEQMLVDCDLHNERPIGMGLGGYLECILSNDCYPGHYYCLLSIHGIPDEDCDPYVGRESNVDTYCNLDYICPDWQDRVWKNTSFHDYKYGEYVGGTPDCLHQTLNLTEAEFKKAIIKGGPMDSGLFASVPGMPAHAMVLEGYETDPGDNQTIWIFKNSWGVYWGEEGYARIKTGLDNINVGSLPLGPVIPPPGQSYEIACVDKDGDGYCNWGISEEKPASCPQSCYPEKDCDDSNAVLGPFDANFNCTLLTSCREDVNNDNFIDALDLKQILSKYFNSESCPEDINKDILVNSIDASRIILHWNETCD